MATHSAATRATSRAKLARALGARHARDNCEEHTMADTNTFEQSAKNPVESVSDMARAAASAVRERADQLPGGQKVQQFAQSAAERLSTTADYVRSHDAKRMLADVERVVKNNPGSSLVVAAALGFVIGRTFTRN
jgi:ElaB/YqjD/DUF883 family membrane-anchored ribosome-binding protein